MPHFDVEFLLKWLQIVVLDLMLAGDNALVIALAVRDLPPEKQFWGRVWGTLGAVVLRLIFIIAVTYILTIPFLQTAGGVLLLGIAYKLIRQSGDSEGEVKAGTSLWEAIWIIVVADVVMSLDNVVAIAGAAHGDLFLVAFGIALSLPLVVWGSGVLARLMGRYPWIIWIGGGVLGQVAGAMIAHDPSLKALLGPGWLKLAPALPWTLAVLFTGMGWIFSKRKKPSES